jgi:hypothetical protein|tara:strand:+ start:1204 stop:1509 length:306 start_codon:yes stop_codon:yes gene_type:complete
MTEEQPTEVVYYETPEEREDLVLQYQDSIGKVSMLHDDHLEDGRKRLTFGIHSSVFLDTPERQSKNLHRKNQIQTIRQKLISRTANIREINELLAIERGLD